MWRKTNVIWTFQHPSTVTNTFIRLRAETNLFLSLISSNFSLLFHFEIEFHRHVIQWQGYIQLDCGTAGDYQVLNTWTDLMIRK